MNFPDDKNIDVACIGNALMDVLTEVTDDFLDEHGLAKGSMSLIEATLADKLLEEISDRDVRTIPGGSSANTARGVSALGGEAFFFGSIGDGMYGKMYDDAMQEAGVQSVFHEGDQLTGFAVTYITPDHERTFATHLGAAAHVPISVIDMEVLKKTKIVHLEAFQLEGPTKVTLDEVIPKMGEFGTKVSLDLNDAGLVNRNLDLFKDIVINYVDILFLNEVEASAFTEQTEPENVIESLKGLSEIVVYKCGEEGAHIITRDGVTTIAAESVTVADTTGAGDLFAAGFLKGLTSGQSLEESGALGANSAAKIITEIGVDVNLIKNTD